MASGWMYLGPDSDSDSDADNTLVTLPGGLACYRHLRYVCHRCGHVDPNYISAVLDGDVDDDDDDDDEDDGDDVDNDGGGDNPSVPPQSHSTFSEPVTRGFMGRAAVLSGRLNPSGGGDNPSVPPQSHNTFSEPVTRGFLGRAAVLSGRLNPNGGGDNPSAPPQSHSTFSEPVTRGFMGRGAVPPRRPGPDLVCPTKFTPPHPTSTPTTLFEARAIAPFGTRLTKRQNSHTFLVFTDGACLNNGQANPRAGWAFVYQPLPFGQPVARRLENRGPTGVPGLQTSNRAEMRAVIGVLKVRSWPGEGCSTMVVATDSEYVVKGATEWVRGWVRNGWRTRAGAEVKNRDLWEALLERIKEMAERGTEVQFWRIPREWNTVADAAAKQGAEQDEEEFFVNLYGVSFG